MGRLETEARDRRIRPIVASFSNQLDKWEILCLARVTKLSQIKITEDLL